MKKHRILIIDDNKELLSLMIEFLSGNEFDVFGFNGILNIRQIEDYQPHMVILDLEMPGLSGYEIIKLIREHKKLKNVPVIIITGLIKLKHKDTLRLAQDIMEKPFFLHDLLKSIRSLLNMELPAANKK